uniref:Peroxiredoxin 1 n=1 Tax=Nephromyces sp. MMRI TaxID=2496275 RepID=A0A3Q8UBN0_9APIC|nr:peroxiredoxin 1 [Nephromyces sp. MMRI]AZL94364.1 peroxiredoxin 1 [Nephromyces sp. MMRI]
MSSSYTSEVFVSKEAPNFECEAFMPNGEFETVKLSDYKDKKWVLLFFYPFNFTFVCPSEIIAFSDSMEEFEKRGVQILGCSVDSKFAHRTWTRLPTSEGGIGQIKYPLLADVNKTIAKQFGVLHTDGMALRGTFIIDKNGVVQTSSINNAPIGRSVDETLRIVDACQHFEKYGEVCPMNWRKGKRAMNPTPEGVASYLLNKKVTSENGTENTVQN